VDTLRIPEFELPVLTDELPDTCAAAENPVEQARWAELQTELRDRCTELTRELDELARMPGFGLALALRSLWRRARGGAFYPLGTESARHTARLGGSSEAADPTSLPELVRAVHRLHTDFEQLRARLNHPGLRPFRLIRSTVSGLPGHAERRAARMERVRRRLRARPLPPAKRTLPPECCPVPVSIVLPTYNRGYLLPRAIASVRQQTYSNWRLIVVDDGSTDETVQIARDARGGADDPRIVWVHNDHRGVSAARNAGLARSDGDWVAFLDSDNVWYADFLERHLGQLHGAAADVVGSYSDLRWFTGDSRPHTISTRFTPAELFHLPQVDLNALVVRASSLRACGGFDEQLTKWVDYELMLRLAAQGRFEHVERVLGEYYRLEDGISRSPDRERPLAPNLARIRHVRRGLLRVGYVLWDYPSASQAFVHRELRDLVSRGIDVHVYYAAAADTPALEPPDVPAFAVSSANELARLALEHGRNVLHGHFAYPTTTLHLWPAAERARIPFTFTGHGVDLFHRKNERRHRVGRIGSSPYCKAAFSIGSFHADYLRKAGVPAPVITPIRCPVDAEWLEPIPDFERPLERVALVSRFVAKKGVLDFIEVARALAQQKLEFELHGYGPLEDEVMRAAAGIPGLTVHLGAISEVAVRRICDRVSAILLPCRRAPDGDMDGLPVILLEGAARGCLLVSSRISSIPDLVVNHKSGFLVEPGHVQGYAEALRSALSLSPTELGGLRRDAFRRVHNEFETRHVTETLIDTWCR